MTRRARGTVSDSPLRIRQHTESSTLAPQLASSPMMNLNVFLTYLNSATSNAASGVWSFVVLPALLLLLTGSASRVGIAEGFQGLSRMVFALPAGFLADKPWCGRSGMLRTAAVCGLFAIATSVLVMLLPFVCVGGGGAHGSNGTRTNGTSSGAGAGAAPLLPHCERLAEADAQFVLICFALCIWGAFNGMRGGAVQALFADSLPTGQRSLPTTINWCLMRIGGVAGPCVALGIFFFRGNTWTLAELRIVFIVGQLLCVLPTSVLFLFSDRRALGASSEAVTMAGTTSSAADSSVEELTEPVADNRGEVSARGKSVDSVTEPEGRVAGTAVLVKVGWCGITLRHVPVLILISDFIMGIASGMTIRFFPLFFKVEVGLSPVAVNAMYAGVMVALTMAGGGARYLSMVIGRVPTMMVTKVLGITCLIAMAFAKPLWKHPGYIVAIYVVRTTLMNCTYSLKKSILMDLVSKKGRGKCNAMDSITMFGWSGSAVVGGFLVDKGGYGATFGATAALQAVGVLIFALILPLVPPEESDGKSGCCACAVRGGGEAAVKPNEVVDASAAVLTEPLLQQQEQQQRLSQGGDGEEG